MHPMFVRIYIAVFFLLINIIENIIRMAKPIIPYIGLLTPNIVLYALPCTVAQPFAPVMAEQKLLMLVYDVFSISVSTENTRPIKVSATMTL